MVQSQAQERISRDYWKWTIPPGSKKKKDSTKRDEKTSGHVWVIRIATIKRSCQTKGGFRRDLETTTETKGKNPQIPWEARENF